MLNYTRVRESRDKRSDKQRKAVLEVSGEKSFGASDFIL